MRLDVLEIDDADQAAAAEQRDRQERLIFIFGQLVEKLEARIFRGAFGEGHDRAILCDPAGDSLPHPDFQFVDLIFVRIFRAPQDQVLAFEHVDKAGIAFHQRDGTFDDLRENFVKRIGGGHAAADGVEQVDFRVAVGTECTVHV